MNLEILSQFYRKIPRNQYLESKLKNRYNYQLKEDFNISQSQVVIGSYIIMFIIYILWILLTGLFRLSVNFIIVGLIVGFLGKYFLNNAFNRYYDKKSKSIEIIFPFVKNFMDLYFSILPSNYDYTILFIELLMRAPSPLQDHFCKLGLMVQYGSNPEKNLEQFISPSTRFKEYIDRLLLTNFQYEKIGIDKSESLEDKYQQFSKSLENRLSLFFFTGIFTPVGLAFGVILQKINPFIIIIFVPICWMILKYIFRHIVQDSQILFGSLIYEDTNVIHEYQDCLELITSVAFYLKFMNVEDAIQKTFKNKKISFTNKIEQELCLLTSYQMSIEQFFQFLETKLIGIRSRILINTLKIMILNSSSESTIQIDRMLLVLQKHKNLEQDRINILKAESFKIYIFQIIIPIIVSLLCAVFIVMANLYGSSYLSLTDIFFLTGDFDNYTVILFTVSLYLINLFSCYYFGQILNRKGIFKLIVFNLIIFISTFLIGYLFMGSFTQFNFSV